MFRLPHYTDTAALTGGTIVIVMCVIVLVAWTIGWWRRR
jgi:hypothetical protein